MAYAYINRYFVVGYYWSITAGSYVCKFPARTDEFMNKFARLPLPDDKPFKDFGYHDYGLTPSAASNQMTVRVRQAQHDHVLYYIKYHGEPSHRMTQRIVEKVAEMRGVTLSVGSWSGDRMVVLFLHLVQI